MNDNIYLDVRGASNSKHITTNVHGYHIFFDILQCRAYTLAWNFLYVFLL